MRLFSLILISSTLFLSGCTSLNHKCNYIPPGNCWAEDAPCQNYMQADNVEICRAFWSCGYNVNPHDP